MLFDIKVVTEDNHVLNFEDINLENISKFSKLLRVTCILMQIAKTKSFKNVARNIVLSLAHTLIVRFFPLLLLPPMICTRSIHILFLRV